jgi:uncharacterized protein (DUF1330 family)
MTDQSVLVIVEVKAITDAEALKRYRLGARAQAAARDCVIVGRGGWLLEGAVDLGEIVVQRWRSLEQFMEWQNSEEYRPLKELRQTCADFRISIVPCSA